VGIEFFRFEGKRRILRPETGKAALIRIDALHAAVSSLLADPDFRVSGCSPLAKAPRLPPGMSTQHRTTLSRRNHLAISKNPVPGDYSERCRAMIVPYVNDMTRRFSSVLTLVHASGLGLEALGYNELTYTDPHLQEESRAF
jgi:hypothetical protein